MESAEAVTVKTFGDGARPPHPGSARGPRTKTKSRFHGAKGGSRSCLVCQVNRWLGASDGNGGVAKVHPVDLLPIDNRARYAVMTRTLGTFAFRW